MQQNMGKLAGRFCELSAGKEVDEKAIQRWNIDLATLRKLGDAYRSGWLHNVLSRITPLTMRRRDDYLMMADVFILTKQEAEHVLDRFDADMELFCAMAGITVTEHMTMYNASPEIKAHIDLYRDVNRIFNRKFAVEERDPVQMLAVAPIMIEHENTFVRDFVKSKFPSA